MKKVDKKENKKGEDQVKSAIKNLEKKYGSNVLMEVSKDIDFEIDWVSTKSFGLDEIIGKGLPRGRVVEVYGMESSGKSTLAMYLMAQIQREGGRVALIDAEMAFDGSYATNIGLDISKLMLSQPESLEETMDIIKELVETNSIDIIVIDSVSALVPKSEIEGGDFMKDTMALQARLMSRALRNLAGPIAKSKTIIIFINQIRDKVGVFFGAKTTTSGGRALKFFSSVRLEVSKGKKIEKDDIQVGNQIIVTATKNKVGFPWKKTMLDLFYAKGLDLHADALDFGEKIGVISRVGNTYSFEKDKLGVGRARAIKKITEDPVLFKKIKLEINKKIDNEK